MGQHLPGFEDAYAIQKLAPDDDFHVHPTQNWVLAKLVRETSRGGILIPSGAHNTEREHFECVEAGPGYTTEHGVQLPMPVKPGDKFIVEGGAQTLPVKHSGEKQWLVRVIWICAMLERVRPEEPSS